MSTVNFLAQEKIWFDKLRYDEAERRFYEHMNGSSQPTQIPKVTQNLSFFSSQLSLIASCY